MGSILGVHLRTRESDDALGLALLLVLIYRKNASLAQLLDRISIDQIKQLCFRESKLNFDIPVREV